MFIFRVFFTSFFALIGFLGVQSPSPFFVCFLVILDIHFHHFFIKRIFISDSFITYLFYHHVVIIVKHSYVFVAQALTLSILGLCIIIYKNHPINHLFLFLFIFLLYFIFIPFSSVVRFEINPILQNQICDLVAYQQLF